MATTDYDNQAVWAAPERLQNAAARVSFLAAFFAAVAAGVGVFWGHVLYGEAGADAQFVSNDIVTLLLAVPVLVAAIVRARGGHRTAVHGWFAALFYLAYNYVPYVVDVPSRWLLLLYLPLLASVALGIRYLSIPVSAAAATVRASGSPIRALPLGICLGALAAFVLGYQVVDVVRALSGVQDSLSGTPGVLLADLLVGVPLLAISATQSVTGRGLGKIGGAAVVLAFALLSAGLLLLFVVDWLRGAAQFAVVDFAVIAVLAAVCLLAYLLTVRAGKPDTDAPSREQDTAPSS